MKAKYNMAKEFDESFVKYTMFLISLADVNEISFLAEHTSRLLYDLVGGFTTFCPISLNTPGSKVMNMSSKAKSSLLCKIPGSEGVQEVDPKTKCCKKLIDSAYKYKGEFDTVTGLAQGRGKLFLTLMGEKSYYKGEFKDGLFDGVGTLKVEFEDALFACADERFMSYCGDWNCGLPHGEGRFEYGDFSDQVIYEGGFKNGWFSSDGRFTICGKSIYEGKFRHSQPQGMGILRNSDGEFTGVFRHGLLNGKRTIVELSNGTKAKGVFVEGRMTEGQITSPDGTVYIVGSEEKKPSELGLLEIMEIDRHLFN